MSETPRKLTPQSTLENLKKEARRWLKALRANDEQARARFHRAIPDLPAQPTLRDVQHALALEHGLSGWTEIKRQLASTPPNQSGGQTHAGRVAWFLRQACPDWRLGGPGAQAAAQQAAARILDRHPEIARDSIYSAVVCGALAEVERILAERPQAASEAGGAKGWEPLHYLCFTRLPLAPSNDNAVAIARALLDRGADPNAHFQIGNARHTPLVGVIGEGEERRPPHTQAQALVQLLLERGANPCDGQVIYNVCQGEGNNPCDWAEVLYAHSVKIGREQDWRDDGQPGSFYGLSWLLSDAVSKNNIRCAEWVLTRGANPNAKRKWSPYSLYEDAARRGFTEMADLLLRAGATPSAVTLSDEEAFVGACLRLDRDGVRRTLERHPEFLQSPKAIFAAAEQDRAEVVEFLLDLGVPIEIEDQQKQRPLHAASSGNALRAAQLLIDRGAEIDPHETNWNATPLGYAVYGQKRAMIDLLSRYTRDVFELTLLAKVDRLREVLREQPELAKARDKNGATPLMWLRDDAPELIELLLANGADPSVRLEDGTTAADLLSRQGLEELAHALQWRERKEGVDPGHAERVASFLRMASLDWRVGGPDRGRQMHAAARLLRRHPEIARDNIYTAVVCGEVDQVEGILRQNPDAAMQPGGSRGWPPLLFLCNARLPMAAASENAVAIARALLDRGADPNVFYPGGNPTIHYTALTSVMGRGEEQASMHPQAEPLARLLLERGAEPDDVQVLYNMFAGHASQRHLGAEAIWLMELMYTHSVARGREADWNDPDWPMLGMGGYGGGARYLLGNAIAVNHVKLVEWLLAHGANPNAPPAQDRRAFKGTLYEDAVRRGLTEIAELLQRYGATTELTALDGEEAFTAACMRLDRAEAEGWIAKHAEFLQSPKPLQSAAQTDRVDVVALLLEFGMSPDVEDPRQGRARPLHFAAYHDSPRVAQLLLDRGAEVDFFDEMHDGSALWWALWGQKPRMVELLSRVSRDVWSLTVAGKVERLREVLSAEPRLAKVTYRNQTPMFWLPDDETSAAGIVELFLAHGADPALKDDEGLTAADRASRRGLEDAARLLRARLE